MRKVLLIIIIALCGIGLIAYPYVANYLFNQNTSSLIQDYSDRSAKLDKTQVAKALKEATTYNENLAGDPVHDPFIPGSGMVRDENYAHILDQGDGMMGYLTIPKIRVNLPIYHGTSGEVLKKGVGHLEGSSLPVGGKRTHAVLTGHTGVSYARLFTDLVNLKVGDTFFIHVFDKTLAYEVDKIEVVLPDNTKDLGLVKDKDYVTLLTCTPYGVNSHRLFVRGTRVPYQPGAEKRAAKQAAGLSQEQRMVLIAAATTAAVMTTLIIVVLQLRRRRQKTSIE